MSEHRSRLLRELHIDDNVHSRVRDNLRNSSEGRRLRRSRDQTLSDNEIKMSTNNNFSNLKGRDTSIDEIPDNLNLLNENVQFSEGNRYVTIKYNSLRLLDFERVFQKRETKEQFDSIGFELYETETLLTSLENESQLPYRGAISNRQDYLTTKTIPRIKDREKFRSLLLNSQFASRFNSNTLIAFPNEWEKKKEKVTSYAKMHSSSVEYIYFQDYEIKTWYKAPYPEEYNKNRILYICDKCLKYMSSKYVYYRHQLKCDYTNPPGNQIYKDMSQGFSIWEVDGRENVIYCQNLCLLAKLFLNSKTLYYDVEPFIFYIVTLKEGDEWKFVGYFSKEKLNSTDYNLSCILTLPHYQRRGIGHLLMDFSYLLSMREFKLGTPEKPLSDLGLVSYRNFWKIKMVQTLDILFNEFGDSLACSIDDLSNLTGMNHSDVIYGLEQIGCIWKYKDEKESEWNHLIKIYNWTSLIEKYQKMISKTKYTLDPKKLIWKPVIFGPSCGINAVGTIVETSTGQQRNTSGGGLDKNNDLFKQSISMLTNFMKDDLSDPRTMEQIAIDKIRNQSYEPKLEPHDLIRAYEFPKTVKEKLLRASKVKLEKEENFSNGKVQTVEANDRSIGVEDDDENFFDAIDELEGLDEDSKKDESQDEEYSENEEEDDFSEDDQKDDLEGPLLDAEIHTRSGRVIHKPTLILSSDGDASSQGEEEEEENDEQYRQLRSGALVERRSSRFRS